MIKLKEVLDKYGEYLVDEEQLGKIIKKPKPKSVWDLENGDTYYYVDKIGRVYPCYWGGSQLDWYRLELGNIFLTIEEAEFEAERRKCEADMLKYGTRDMMSLDDGYSFIYCICFNHYTKEMYIGSYQNTHFQGMIYFATRELAQKAIDEIGEKRLKKYVFNVKE